MATAIEEFFVKLGFDVDDKELKSFAKSLEATKVMMFAVGAAAVAAGAALAGFTAHIAEELDTLGDFAEAEKVSAKALEELGYAARLNGSSLDAVKGSVSGLNRIMGEAIIGIGRGAKTFEKLGLSAKNADGTVKTFDQMLGEIADKMQGLSRQEQIAMSEKLGIDRSLVPLLVKGKDALEAYRKEAQELGVATQEDFEQAGLFADSMDKVGQIMKGISYVIAGRLMPSLRGMVDEFIEWYKTNRDIIKLAIERTISVITMVTGALWAVLKGIVSVLASVVNWFSQTKWAMQLLIAVMATFIGMALVSTVASMIAGFGRFVAVIRSLAVAFAALNFQAMIVPVLIGAIVAGLALLIEDYYQWKQGNLSVIGDILAQYPGVKVLIDQIAGAVMGIGAAYDYVVGKVSQFIEFVAQSASAVQNLFSMGFGGGASMRLPGSLTAPRAPLGAIAGSRNVSTTNAQSNTFNINSTHPKAAAAEVSKHLVKQNRNVSRNNRSAVVQ